MEKDIIFKGIVGLISAMPFLPPKFTALNRDLSKIAKRGEGYGDKRGIKVEREKMVLTKRGGGDIMNKLTAREAGITEEKKGLKKTFLKK